MRGGGGGEIEGIGPVDEVFLHDEILLIDRRWWSLSSYDRRGAPLPAFKHTTISQHTTQQVSIVKTGKNYHYLCLLASLRHNASSMCRA